MRRLCFAGVFCGFALAGAARAERPSAEWRTIETAHFRVHFPAPFAPWAARAASALEGVHGRVSEYVGYEPTRPIDVVVSDPEADSNGIAFPFLDRPRIDLWTTPPTPESGIGEFRDWTELLVTHEFAHIVHLTRPRNRPGALERILPLPIGPVFWNSPRWVAEGYATLVEGALTGSGRPSSIYRSTVLRRFAIEGKLPSYSGLNAASGWLGGSMAYLVGSSFLEWLEAREGAGSLRRLWKRMASRRGGGFGAAFRAVFGRSPSDLYDRFRAELTARALEQERQLDSAGLVAGEKWQRLEGGTASPQVSPDGARLLAHRAPRRGESFLAVWTLAPSPREREGEARRRERERELLGDPNEVPEKRELPEPRVPARTLPRENGYSPEDARWMPDSRRVLFTRRAPGPDGALHRDLFLWDTESGSVARRTHLADLSDADPGRDGSAVAVRDRYGASELVRVDLATGQVSPLAPPPAGDPWQVWSHPRLSPDGARIAALLHRQGRWRLVLLRASGGGEPREISTPGGVFGAPSWSPDGRRLYVATDGSGIWELTELDLDSGAARSLTRVTGGAFSAAPEPDGKALFFLELTARGVDIRRLTVPADPPAPLPGPLPAIFPPPAAQERPLTLAPVGPPRRYRARETHVVRLFSAFTAGPDGTSYQTGAQGTDVLGRLDWIAAAAFGNAAGPRGGTVALSWLGFPVELRAQIFSALERPGGQRLVARRELDSERQGGAVTASWQVFLPSGRIRAEAWAGATRVESLAEDIRFNRALAGARVRAEWRRFRAKNGVAAALEGGGEFGRTRDSPWSARWGGLRVSGSAGGATLSLLARSGATGGTPTAFDLFAIGGASSTILPPALDENRIGSPALPAASQIGERFEGFRADLSSASLPLSFYAERWRAWSGAVRPDPIRLEGVELRLDRLVPLADSLSLYAGAARVRSRSPRFDSIRGYAGLIYRP